MGYVPMGHWDPVLGVSPIPTPPDLWAAQRGFVTFADLTGFHAMVGHRPVRGAGETTIGYDTDYCLMRSVTAPDGCTTQVVAMDYRVMKPLRIDDPNENSQEACYDGLGRILARTFWGTEPEIGDDGVVGPATPVGFAHIDAFERPFALPGEAIAQPGLAIQDMAEAFFYDAFSGMRVKATLASRVPAALVPQVFWSIPGRQEHYLRAAVRWQLADPAYLPALPVEVRQALIDAPCEPVHGAALLADRYPEDPERQIRIMVSASDGFGRALQVKQKVPGGEAYVVEGGALALDASGQPKREVTTTRWRVSERVEYNNKGMVVRVYRPYFANTHAHIRDEAFRQFGYCDRQYYDPLGRPIKTLTPREERVPETPRYQRRGRRREAPSTWVVKWYMKRWTYFPWYVVAEDENDTAFEMEAAHDSPVTETAG